MGMPEKLEPYPIPAEKDRSSFIPSLQHRPKYVSFDCYGTLIEWPMNPITYELVGDQIPAEQWDQFVREFRGYRYDQVRGEYYPYEQVLQDSFERVCRKWGVKAGLLS
jgi:2-haloacid dehalogenase